MVLDIVNTVRVTKKKLQEIRNHGGQPTQVHQSVGLALYIKYWRIECYTGMNSSAATLALLPRPPYNIISTPIAWMWNVGMRLTTDGIHPNIVAGQKFHPAPCGNIQALCNHQYRTKTRAL